MQHPSRARPEPRRRLDLLLAALAGAYVLVAVFPDVTYIPSGLDGAWRIELGRIHAERLFGREVVFTYGPLGYLLVPTDAPWELLGASLLRFAHQVALATLVGWLVVTRRWVGAAVVTATQLAAAWLGLLFEHGLLLLLPFVALPVLTGRAWWLLIPSALAAAGLFAKTSLGIGALGVTAAIAALLVVQRRAAAIRPLVFAVAAGCAMIAAVGALSLRSSSDLGPWLRWSWQLADAYSVAMSVEGATSHSAVAVGVLVAWLVLTAALLWRRALSGALALALTVPVFLTFKHGFVRHDSFHELAFFPFLVAALGLVFAFGRSRFERTASSAVLALVLCAGVWAARTTVGAYQPPLTDLLDAKRGLRLLRAWSDLGGLSRHQRYMIEAALSADRIPGLRAQVGAASVGIVPWETSECQANGLRCSVNPTLQLYAAYTPDLDRLTAEHYARPDAPTFVVVDNQAIDGRSVLLDTPATLRELLRWYDRAPGGDLPGDRVLLRRRDSPAIEEPLVAGRSEALPGHWVEVPALSGLVMASVEFELSVLGRLAKALYKIPEIRMEVVYCDGRVASFRVVPGTARNGLLLSGLAGERGLAGVFERQAGGRPVLVRFTGSGMRYMRAPLRLTWSTLPAPEQPGRCEAAGPDVSSLAVLGAPGKPLIAIDDFAAALEEGHGGVLRLKGWAVDPIAGLPAAGILVEVAGQVGWIPVGTARPDVAAVLGVPGYANSGYTGAVRVGALPNGRHRVSVRVVSHDGRGYYADPQFRVVEMGRAPGPGPWQRLRSSRVPRHGLIFLGVLVAALASCGLAALARGPAGTASRGESTAARATVACVAVGVALGILGSKLATICRHAADLPFWDQWEDAALHVAHRTGTLTWGALLEPHSEHRILLSRVLDLLLASANGQWDNRLQAVVNAGIHTAAVLALLAVATVPLRRMESAVVTLVAALAAALPFAHENLGWGFQSQFYLDLLFSIVGVGLAAGARPLSARWFLGLAIASVSMFAIGSGLLAPAVLALAWGVDAARSPTGRTRAALAACCAAVPAALGVLALHRPEAHAALGAHGVGEFAVAFARGAAWPATGRPWLAIILWLPAMALAIRHLRSRQEDGAVRALLAVGAWALLHAPAIALARGAGGAGPASRYADILAVGIVVNAAAALLFARDALPGAPRRLAAIGVVAWSLAAFAPGYRLLLRTEADMRRFDEARAGQVENVRRFVATDDVAALRDKPFLHIPYPLAESLAAALRSPIIRGILPASVRSDAVVPGPLSSWSERLLRSGSAIAVVGWCVAGLGLAAGAAGALRVRRAVHAAGERTHEPRGAAASER